MRTPEILPKSEKQIIECENCERVYNPTTSFTLIEIPREDEKTSTLYLVGKCPNCGTQDKVLFEWSKIEIQKERSKSATPQPEDKSLFSSQARP